MASRRCPIADLEEEGAMPRQAKPQNATAPHKKPAAKPKDELAEHDLDKVSGGVNKQTTKTPPPGPIPIPYPNQA